MVWCSIRLLLLVLVLWRTAMRHDWTRKSVWNQSESRSVRSCRGGARHQNNQCKLEIENSMYTHISSSGWPPDQHPASDCTRFPLLLSKTKSHIGQTATKLSLHAYIYIYITSAKCAAQRGSSNYFYHSFGCRCGSITHKGARPKRKALRLWHESKQSKVAMAQRPS